MAKRTPKYIDDIPMNPVYCGNCGRYLGNEAIKEGRVDIYCRCKFYTIRARSKDFERAVLKAYPQLKRKNT